MTFAATAKSYKELGSKMMDASLGTAAFGPIIRQPVPEAATQLVLLHWLFAAKANSPIPTTVLDYQASAAGGQLVIPASAGGGAVSRVWKVYPADRPLLYPSPFSPVLGGGEVVIGVDDWQVINGRTVISKPAITDGLWRVIYRHDSNRDVIQRGDGYQAYPTMMPIPIGFSSMSPDTARWFDIAVERAIVNDDREGKAAQWTKLRDAMRRSIVRTKVINDKRDVFLPLKGMGALDAEGMLCRSDHPSAMPPPVPMNQAWTGYNFWSRDNSTGDTLAIVPSTGPTAYSVVLGRDMIDAWRATAAYQDPDQYLYVELGAKIEADGSMPAGTVRVYVSSARTETSSTRWEALVDLAAGTLVETVGGIAIKGYLIPRASLLRVDNASALPDGQQVLRFGVDFRLLGRYNARIRKMRFLSGVSAAWVTANLAQAKAGSRLPYSPGATPAFLSGYPATDNVLGYNGCPMIGYQFPDAWVSLAAEAAVVHAGLTAAQLPIPNAAGALTYPITANNANGQAKPINLLLAEQQVMMLRDAQARYAVDRGVTGPLAHTYVLNTSARHSIGSPTPHTWVYTGDAPDTSWAGFQVRPIEALCRLVFLTKDTTNAQDVRTLATTVANNWLNWLAGYWPNLNGAPWRGPPTNYSGTAAPTTGYEDPHVAAIVLRALMYLRMAGDTDTTRAALAVRCWDFLELCWVIEGRMTSTWSPVPDQRKWYGYWHGEIIETMALLVQEGKGVLPVGISRDVALDRLSKTYNWLSQWGIREVS